MMNSDVFVFHSSPAQLCTMWCLRYNVQGLFYVFSFFKWERHPIVCVFTSFVPVSSLVDEAEGL